MDEICKRQKEVERTYGGLLPAVEGHSLCSRYKVQFGGGGGGGGSSVGKARDSW